MANIIYAEDGYVWKSKKENWIGSNVLVLGKNDSIDNYEQIKEPEQIAEEPKGE